MNNQLRQEFLQALYNKLASAKLDASLPLIECVILSILAQGDRIYSESIFDQIDVFFKNYGNQFLADSGLKSKAREELTRLGILKSVQVKRPKATNTTKAVLFEFVINDQFEAFSLGVLALTTQYLKTSKITRATNLQVKILICNLLRRCEVSYKDFKQLLNLTSLKMLEPQLLLPREMLVCYAAYAITKGKTKLGEIDKFFPKSEFRLITNLKHRLSREALPFLTEELKVTSSVNLTPARKRNPEYEYTIIPNEDCLVKLMSNIWLNYYQNQGVVSNNAFNQLYPYTGLSKP